MTDPQLLRMISAAYPTQGQQFNVRINACANCGAQCRGHWCSESCRRAEDGLSFEEAAQLEDD